MPIRAKKLILVGLDGAFPKEIQRLAREGRLPRFKRLLENGASAENCLPCFPTITPPNWTTIVTGAWPGTHGITDFNVHNPGDPLDQVHQGFWVSDCQAEYIWDAAARAGKRTILFNYPSTYGAEPKGGIRVGGGGLAVNEYRLRGQQGVEAELCDSQLFSPQPYPQAASIEPRKAQGWKNLPPSEGGDLEAELAFYFPRARKPVKPAPPWFGLIQNSQGKGYNRVLVSPVKDAGKAVATLRPGEWSDKVYATFATDEGSREVVFRVKLLQLSEDGRDFRLFFTPFCRMDGWSWPESVAAELRDVAGLPAPSSIFDRYRHGWVEPETLVEACDMEHDWFAGALSRLMDRHPWDMIFMHAHCPDHVGHTILTKADPLTNKDKDSAAYHQAIIERLYASLDRMLGRILEKADEETLVIVVSDHGSAATGIQVPVPRILEAAGLLKRKDPTDTSRHPPVVWSETKAAPQRSCYIYVNLKGRYPHGTVDPEEYENVRDQVISALCGYVDPQTGRRPVTFAVRKEHARMLGLYGDRIGDVVFGVDKPFAGQHGSVLPTSEWGLGSLRSVFIMAGPNVKRGMTLQRHMWITDIVPTVCYLMGLPVPAQAEGAVIYQALEDPDFRAAG